MNKPGKARDIPLAWTWYFFISSPLSSLSFPQRSVLIGDPSYCSCILQHPHQPAYFRDPDTNSEPKLRAQIVSSPRLITLMRPSISTRAWQVGGSVANTVFATRPESMPFLLKRNRGARYLFSMLLSAMPNEILALQAELTFSNTSSSLATWPEKAQSEITWAAAPKLFLTGFAPCWTHVADLKRCSQKEALEIGTCFSSFFLSRACTQPSGDSASLLKVPGLLGIHLARVLPGSLPEWTSGSLHGQADRTISLGSSPERHNAHAALTGSNDVPTGLAHSDKFLSHSSS